MFGHVVRMATVHLRRFTMSWLPASKTDCAPSTSPTSIVCRPAVSIPNCTSLVPRLDPLETTASITGSFAQMTCVHTHLSHNSNPPKLHDDHPSHHLHNLSYLLPTRQRYHQRAAVVVLLVRTLTISRTAHPTAESRPICTSSPHLSFSAIISITDPSALLAIKTAGLFPATETQQRIPPSASISFHHRCHCRQYPRILKITHTRISIQTTHASRNDAPQHARQRPYPQS